MSRRRAVTSGIWSPNDRVSTKIDIVNPMPPRQATATSIAQEAFAGISPTRSLTAMRLAREIPTGFPRTRPRNTPMLTLPRAWSNWNTLKYDTSVISTPALARAKIGMIRKLTHGPSACSRRWLIPMESLEMADRRLRQCLCGPLGKSGDVEAMSSYSFILRMYWRRLRWK